MKPRCRRGPLPRCWVPVVVLCVTWSVAGCAPQPGRYERYRAGGSYDGCRPTYSPLRDRVMYSTPKSGHGDVYEVDLRGRQSRVLIGGPDYEGEACVSADGSRIAFVREHMRNGQIWVCGVSGSEQRRITDGASDDGWPAWSHDGRTVVFSRRLGDTSEFRLYAAQADGTGTPRPLTHEGWGAYYPCVGPDGTVYDGHQGERGPVDIRALDLGSGRPLRTLGIGVCSAVSPDGRTLIVTPDYPEKDMRTVPVGGGVFRSVYSPTGVLQSPGFMPDGKRVLFYEMLTPTGMGDVVLLDLRTGERRQVVATP